MAKINDTIGDENYSSTVRKILVINNGSPISSDNPLTSLVRWNSSAISVNNPIPTRTNISGDVTVTGSVYSFRDSASNNRDALVDSSDRIIISPTSNLTVTANVDSTTATVYQGTNPWEVEFTQPIQAYSNQSGTWTTDRNWNLASNIDSITTVRTWNLDSSTDSVSITRNWNLASNTDSVSTIRTWNLDSSTDSITINTRYLDSSTDSINTRHLDSSTDSVSVMKTWNLDSSTDSVNTRYLDSSTDSVNTRNLDSSTDSINTRYLNSSTDSINTRYLDSSTDSVAIAPNNYSVMITNGTDMVEVATDGGLQQNALVVATRNLKTYSNAVRFLTNPTYGVNMNCSVGFGINQISIHDGNDHAYWNNSAVIGTWNFTDATYAHTGTHSIGAENTVDGDIAQLTNSIALNVDTMAAFCAWIYAASWSDDNVTFTWWNSSTASANGDSINASDYFDTGSLNTWQHVIIPIVNFNMDTTQVDALRIQTVASGVAPNYWLDDICLSQTISPVTFSLAPAADKWLYINSFQISLADEYTGFVNTGDTTIYPTMPSIPYDGFLGVGTLTNGLVIQRVQGETIQWSSTLRDLFDFAALPEMKVNGYGCDGTNTWITISQMMTEPILLRGELNDEMRYVVNDDLSGLLKLKVACGCREEQR